MKDETPSGARRLLLRLASPRITVACLLWLAVLTCWGTVHEAGHGLYAARERFFHAWLFLAWGWLPLPGMQGTSAVVLLNLAASMLARFRATPRWIGLWIVHAGIFVLLAGSYLARGFGRETVLQLAEGERAQMSVSEAEWELAAWPAQAGARQVTAWPFADLREGQALAVPGVRDLRVVRRHAHAEIRADATNLDVAALQPSAHASDPARNRPALVLGGPLGETAVLVGEGPACGVAGDDGGTVILALRRARHPLPVTVRLLDFETKYHPNSSIPRSFSSRVEVEADGVRREVTIAMNRPFRHGAFTFFQSSWSTAPDGREISIFAVSENRGRIVPYAATGLIFVGMLLAYGLRGRDPEAAA